MTPRSPASRDVQLSPVARLNVLPITDPGGQAALADAGRKIVAAATVRPDKNLNHGSRTGGTAGSGRTLEPMVQENSARNSGARPGQRHRRETRRHRLMGGYAKAGSSRRCESVGGEGARTADGKASRPSTVSATTSRGPGSTATSPREKAGSRGGGPSLVHDETAEPLQVTPPKAVASSWGVRSRRTCPGDHDPVLRAPWRSPPSGSAYSVTSRWRLAVSA
jgi:hypothetical protein